MGKSISSEQGFNHKDTKAQKKSEISKSDKSWISNPKSRNLKMDWSNLRFRDFGFEMQDSSDFKISDLFP